MESIIANVEKLPSIVEFKMNLRKKKYNTSTSISMSTVDLFKELIKHWIERGIVTEYKALISLILHLEKVFVSIDPLQFSIGNVIKRILFIIREEQSKAHPFQEEEKKKEEEIKIKKTLGLQRKLTYQSLNSVIDYKSLQLAKKSSLADKYFDDQENLLKTVRKKMSEKIINSELMESLENILNNINDLYDELDSMTDAIKDQALDYIKEGDIILTSNHSEQLEEFFIEAKQNKINFKVIVAESSPSLKGIDQAKKLIENGIDTKVISDSAVYAIMPKVSKVFIGTRAIIANGGLISYNGAYNLCLCANMFSIPVVVVCGTFKLTPSYPFGHESINEYLSPDVLCSNEVEYNDNINNIAFNIPAYDYVPPEHITIYITNHGSENPKNIYRLFSELYSQEDYFS
ncbi:MAG: translation initiation factor eIF-2B [archaeon]|nr:translation initiation factor eIF-2B [archaeon]